jgi:hypothetical protein
MFARQTQESYKGKNHCGLEKSESQQFQGWCNIYFWDKSVKSARREM